MGEWYRYDDIGIMFEGSVSPESRSLSSVTSSPRATLLARTKPIWPDGYEGTVVKA